jgi:hypothetical protein
LTLCDSLVTPKPVAGIERGPEWYAATFTCICTRLCDGPGWRFELIIDGTVTEPRQPLSATQIRALLEEVKELKQCKHLVAALLVLWSATESAGCDCQASLAEALGLT